MYVQLLQKLLSFHKEGSSCTETQTHKSNLGTWEQVLPNSRTFTKYFPKNASGSLFESSTLTHKHMNTPCLVLGAIQTKATGGQQRTWSQQGQTDGAF